MQEQSPLRPDSAKKYLAADTIVALSSQMGGAIGIVRMSGPSAFSIFKALRASSLAELPAPRSATRVTLWDPRTGNPVDDAMAILYQGPASYTGEDTVEWMIHGNPRIGQALVEAALHVGARQALPGEFSFRAVRNGKLSLEQAKAVADLIAAQNQNAIALALDQLSGAQSQWVLTLAQEIKKLATLSELGIDFSDQDVEELALPRLKEDCRALINRLQRLLQSLTRGQRIQNGVTVSLVGRPNAGKSSLFNALLGEDRSIVSPIAGTTRDTVREIFTLGEGLRQTTFRFEDTAGIRETQDPIEKEGVARSLKSAAHADLSLIVVDVSQKDALQTAQTLISGNLSPRPLLVFTQTDRITAAELGALKLRAGSAFTDTPTLWVSIPELSGLDALVDALITAALTWTLRQPGELVLTRLDQAEAIQKCTIDLTRALDASTEDLFAADIRQGLVRLAPLIGETVPDDILGQIFSDFCIGK